MDFPKSVPGVGLVGGLFVDENPATGQPGSLMAAVWGNAVTEELLSIIRAAGLEPDEAKTNQVLEAIRAMVPERSAFARRTGTNSLPADAFGIFALADGGTAATVTLPSVADLGSDTELLLFANHANSAVVQIKAAVGQTVQGPAGLMGESATAFVLPAGGDWVRLRSEKAQNRWVVAGAYPAGVEAQVLLLKNRVAELEGVGTKYAYVNGGTAAAPASVAANLSYSAPNPFPGFAVACTPQILLSGIWVDLQTASSLAGVYVGASAGRKSTTDTVHFVTAAAAVWKPVANAIEIPDTGTAAISWTDARITGARIRVCKLRVLP